MRYYIKSTIHGYIKSNHFICHITNSTCAVESAKLGSVLQTVQNTIDTFNKYTLYMFGHFSNDSILVYALYQAINYKIYKHNTQMYTE